MLSFRQRNEMAAIAERAGWSPIAARRLEKAERRFILSAARIAVVDARGAFEDGIKAVQLLAEAVEANAAALLVLISKTDTDRIDEVLAAGATHYLASPFGEQELIQALRFADRYTVRVGGRLHQAVQDVPNVGADLGWSYDQAKGLVEPSAALHMHLGLPGEPGDTMAWSDFVSVLGSDAQRDSERAFAKLEADREPTAFVHDVPNGGTGRMVHHLTLGEVDSQIDGRVELPDEEASGQSIADRDYLTGIGDARAAHRWLDKQLGEESGAESEFALILLSLHRFERINQAYGSAIGDAALQGMARRIERLVMGMPMRNKLIARLAGAEFAIGLAPGVSLDEAEFVAQQLNGVIEQPFITDGQVIRLKARSGIVTSSETDSDAAGIMRRASVALAEARSGDSSAISVFGRDEELAAAKDSRLEIDLRLALDRDEIEILFQPQVSITSGKVIGVEALARWQHPGFGELGAVALFAAAERSDYLTELSTHVQRKAIEIAAGWKDACAALRVSINVTAADMAEDGFVQRFATMVDDAGMRRDLVTAEVTESGLIEDLGVAADHLAELRADGFRVAIDDFGTGYSSLAYLKSLPMDYLKIDRRLSQDITGCARDRIVVTGVIEMARSLGLSVIAEGVETEEQLSMLAEQGCELYQGYLFAPPVSSDELAALVSQDD